MYFIQKKKKKLWCIIMIIYTKLITTNTVQGMASARTFSRIGTGPKPHKGSTSILSLWLISPYLVVHCLFRIAYARNNVPLLWFGIALESIAVGQSFGGGNQFQSHYHHFQWDRFYVRNNHIGPHPHEWDQSVIMKLPQTSSYK